MIKKLTRKVFIPLLLGGLIYILFRPENLHLFRWLDLIGLGEFTGLLRLYAAQIELIDWMVYSLPNGLWLYAFVNMSLLIWNNQINRINLFWIIIPAILGVGYEFGQYFGFIPGTYDVVDLITCLLATAVPFLTSTYQRVNWKNIELKTARLSFSVVGCFLFLFLAAGSNGPADATQDLYIETEKDPVVKEKMKRKEEFYHQHNRTTVTQAQSDSIDAVVDSLVQYWEN